METAELLSRLKPSSNYKQQAEALREHSNFHSIVDLIRPQEAWEMCLNALANLQKQPQTSLKPESELRLAWFITFYPSKCVLQPKEQKINAKGEWSKGRPIALKRLSSGLSENAVSGIVTVHSDIGGGSEGAEEVPTQTLPHIHLLPANVGLKITLLSRPFAQGSPYFRPGTGGETVIAEIEGKRLQTRRNLSLEKQLAAHAVAACPTLAQSEEQDGEWVIVEPESCLELLLELQALGNKVVMAWPEGEKLRISHNADLKDFNLSIQRQQDWFAASGELKLNNDLVLDMQQLLEFRTYATGTSNGALRAPSAQKLHKRHSNIWTF